MLVVMSVVGWWANKTLSCMSRSSLLVVVVRFSIVCDGVQMNFIPKPRTDFARGSTVFLWVRSWKASLDLLKY